MKTDIHPDYQAVVFRDLGSGETFLTRSTVTSNCASSRSRPASSGGRWPHW